MDRWEWVRLRGKGRCFLIMRKLRHREPGWPGALQLELYTNPLPLTLQVQRAQAQARPSAQLLCLPLLGLGLQT